MDDKNTGTGFQSYEEALTFLYKAIDYEKLISYQYNASTFSLDRMVKMLEYVGNPHKRFPSIHITGTKGKGFHVHYDVNHSGACGSYNRAIYLSTPD